mmetsp:Transcript_28533/g.88876  ORF Transcript_28533/g.88876 Transcript_28533/m.88876 type:complete len:289 (-) Transcript_28533:184-1050(-)
MGRAADARMQAHDQARVGSAARHAWQHDPSRPMVRALPPCSEASQEHPGCHSRQVGQHSHRQDKEDDEEDAELVPIQARELLQVQLVLLGGQLALAGRTLLEGDRDILYGRASAPDHDLEADLEPDEIQAPFAATQHLLGDAEESTHGVGAPGDRPSEHGRPSADDLPQDGPLEADSAAGHVPGADGELRLALQHRPCDVGHALGLVLQVCVHTEHRRVYRELEAEEDGAAQPLAFRPLAAVYSDCEALLRKLLRDLFGLFAAGTLIVNDEELSLEARGLCRLEEPLA